MNNEKVMRTWARSGARIADGESAAGQRNEVLGGDVGGKQRGTNHRPAQRGPGKKVGLTV